jgi:hypothetical protein
VDSAVIVSISGIEKRHRVDRGTVEVLGAESLLRVVEISALEFPKALLFAHARIALRCTVTGKLLKAVTRNFTDETAPASFGSNLITPEIALSLDRLRRKFPDPSVLGLVVMRFAAAKPFSRIVDVIKQTGEKHGITLVRADENEFHSDLWGNVRTHLHGCGFGVAVYERIESDEPNANVGLEVGYLMAMNKPVLLLKDKTVEALQADLAGKLYKPFDPHDPEGSIPEQMAKWLEDNGIIVPSRDQLSLGKAS